MTARAWAAALAMTLSLGGVASGQSQPVEADIRGVSSPRVPDKSGTYAVGTAARVHRVEVAVLGGVVTGADLGDGRAEMLGNQAPTGAPTALFTTSARIASAASIEGRVGVRLSRHLSVESGVSVSRPTFEVDIARDIEGAPGVTASSRLTQVIVDGALMYRWRGRRVSPFVLGGGGYLRQLDEPQTTAATGSMYFGGGGLLVALAPGSRGLAGRLSLRGDARVAILRGGITLEEERPAGFIVAGGIVVGL